jgi:starch synthase
MAEERGHASRRPTLEVCLKVLFVSAEVAPFAKVGGLADVAGSLPKALKKLGHDVRVIMPAYRMVEEDPRWPVETLVESFPVRINSHWTKLAYLKSIKHDGVEFLLVGTDQWFNEVNRSEELYQASVDPYLFFTEAVLEATRVLGWHPDVVHCNDWQTAFIPVVMREKHAAQWSNTAAIYTIHNLAYQGEFGTEILAQLDLPMRLYNAHQLETWGRVNFLKAGCVFADEVNTVSPRYADEIQSPEYGCTLEGLMRHLAREGRLSGILNGIDTDEFDPATDPRIASPYSAENLSGKSACQEALRIELGLRPMPGAPLMSVVSRLSSQKGIDLIAEAAPRMFAQGAQLVVLGTGDPAIASQLDQLQKWFPDYVRLVERFDVDLAQRIYAGADIFLMPSSFEPCGLGQMIAMRYGTVPVVRATGGLANTVFEGKNGFVLHERTPDALIDAVNRARTAFNDPARWQKLMLAGMKADLGWTKSAKEYADLYESAVRTRRSKQVQTA